MKIKKESGFQPVTVTFESKWEWNKFIGMVFLRRKQLVKKLYYNDEFVTPKIFEDTESESQMWESLATGTRGSQWIEVDV